ncbi:uncharacterized protein LOC144738434 isoform X2 [Lampetra planeri]
MLKHILFVQILGAEQTWHWLEKRLEDMKVIGPADDWCRQCQDWRLWRRIGLMEQRHSAQLSRQRQQWDQYANSMDCTGNFTQDQRSPTGEKPFNCTVCGKAFLDSFNLKKHQRTHTGEKPFRCSVCGKEFLFSSGLKKHERTHTGEKPFKCTVCGKAFSSSYYLKIHQRTHTGDKPFKCSVCEMAFSHSSNLKIHQRIHTGEKPFKCTVCGKAFAQTTQLNTHQITHWHQKTPKECSLKSTCESQSAAMSPSLLKKEPEVNSSLDTMKCIKVKFEEATVKSEEVTVKSEEVKVKCEDEHSTPKSDLHINGGNVKQEENSDCEAERGNSQQFVEVEVWVDFLDNTKSNGEPVDV